MDGKRWNQINNHPLSSKLVWFLDVLGDTEAIELIKDHCAAGYQEVIKEDIIFVEKIVETPPDPEFIRDFVTWEMNKDFEDPSGEKQAAWLVHAVEIMKKALREYEEICDETT